MSTQLVVILIMIGISFVSWIFGKAKEQREIQRINRARDRQRQEALRTGRGLGETSAGQRAPRIQAQQKTTEAQTLAERRQAQLRALREQQLARMRSQMGGQQQRTTPAAPRRAPRPAVAPPSRRPQQPARQSPTARPRPRQAPSRSAGAAQAQRSRLPRAGAAKPVASRKQASAPPSKGELSSGDARRRDRRVKRAKEREDRADQRRYERLTHDHPDEHPAAPRPAATLFGEGVTLKDWRRAIVMNEILLPPVSERESHFD